MDTRSLMEQIVSNDNLNAAYLQIVRNKGAAGVDGMTVEELGAYLAENGENIRKQLRTRKYKPQPVRRWRYQNQMEGQETLEYQR